MIELKLLVPRKAGPRKQGKIMSRVLLAGTSIKRSTMTIGLLSTATLEVTILLYGTASRRQMSFSLGVVVTDSRRFERQLFREKDKHGGTNNERRQISDKDD